MVYTYDLATDVGKVRLLVPDTSATSYVFEDDEITAFLALETDVRRAAALALETIASSQALTLKVIKILDLQTDGARTAEALLKRAATLRQQALEAEAGEEDGGFEVIEMVPNAFAYRDRLYKEMLRSL
ncbi:MAG: hypothetical protein JXA87_04845 [Thermoleophilia bacterium]|nr:hypothetical protein [Thermoleophilia bacterium]